MIINYIRSVFHWKRKAEVRKAKLNSLIFFIAFRIYNAKNKKFTMKNMPFGPFLLLLKNAQNTKLKVVFTVYILSKVKNAMSSASNKSRQ